MAKEIVNKVATSGLVTIELEKYYLEGERVLYDLKDNLWEGMALKETDFRQFVEDCDWSVFKDKYVAISCSADAIVPTWAYMLLATVIEPYARKIVFGDLETLETILFKEQLDQLNPEDFKDARIVIKGCSEKPVPQSAYVEITEKLRPYARSIMYGEPCSTVPLYKAKKKE